MKIKFKVRLEPILIKRKLQNVDPSIDLSAEEIMDKVKFLLMLNPRI